MKTAALFFSGLLLSAFVSGPVAAAPVRVKLTARVTQVDDPSNVLAGKVVLGQRVNGSYLYNTNTPNQAPFPGYGDYRPYANEARIRFAVGSHVFENVQPTQSMGIIVRSEPTWGEGQFTMMSWENKPLANGALVQSITLELRGTGNMTESDALPAVAPALTNSYWVKDVSISGVFNGNSFTVRAQLEASELIVPDALEVSPASGSFVANQHFDAALILPRNSTVASVHARVNGMFLPFNYPGNCQLNAAVGAGRPSLKCPDASWVLPLAAGAPIEWTVELTNGTVLTETVNWELAP